LFTLRYTIVLKAKKKKEMAALYETFAFGKASKDDPFKPIKIKRSDVGPDDVKFDILFCGICHSDVHYANDDMGLTKWPLVPGHELAGVVTAIGANVKSVAVGDRVGLGCIVDSCMSCYQCSKSQEQYCEKGFTITCSTDITHGHIGTDTGFTYGGFSGSLSVHERFIIKIPRGYPLEAAGPLFCAGITVYSPLAHWGALKGNLRIGVVGIGGLGQMAVRLAAAMGNKVTAISSSPSKRAAALEIGATEFVISTDEASMKAAAGSLDLILNTVSANHQVSHYLPLLALDGTIVQLGLVGAPHQVVQQELIMRRLSISGSAIGGTKETQECIDFCAKHNVVISYELIKADRLDEVFKNLATKNDSVKRFVLDTHNSSH